MQILRQLYDEQCQPITGQGASKEDVLTKALLHGASHIWIWRPGRNGPEVLLQKRAIHKRTWPGFFDISAAGHIDLGEEPLAAALRELREELGLDIDESDLEFVTVHRAHIVIDARTTENEFQWIYLLEAPSHAPLTLQTSEVDSTEWKSLEALQSETQDQDSPYVPHGPAYFNTVIAAIRRAVAS